MIDLYVSWAEYHLKIEQLAVVIYKSDWSFDQIICLARGGLRIGDTLSRIYNCPLAVLAASSYRERQQKALNIAPSLTMTTPELGRKVLLVDDLVDSGLTLEHTLIWLEEHVETEEVRTAVIWHKSASSIQPNYCVDYLEDNPWIHQPFEQYEQINPSDLDQQSNDRTSLTN